LLLRKLKGIDFGEMLIIRAIVGGAGADRWIGNGGAYTAAHLPICAAVGAEALPATLLQGANLVLLYLYCQVFQRA
jgi:hypothetical protein